MEGKFHGLPPLKRFRLMQQVVEEEKENIRLNQKIENPITHSCLPAKKRKECRNSPPFLLDSINNAKFCLPAKKRVWAIQPFDLNLEYKSSFDFDEQEILPDSQELSPGSINHDVGIEEENVETEANCIHEESDGIVCAVCESTDGDPKDPIVLCDGCDLMVHTTCYGHPFTNGVPDGEWFCAQCLATRSSQSFSRKPEICCCLCSLSGGALKPTADSKWAHLVCAIYVPEVFFSDPDGRESIDCSKIPERRWKQECYVCESKKGCVIDCSEPNCKLAFHVTCGLKAELCIEYRQRKNRGAVVAAFCAAHTDLWKKQVQTGKFKIVARDDHK
ncbi:uncharacterized protein [Primulina eburnea]|uniref:uncharacterized protein n=1 Tax=Primulina eburnea TaxID=1245227 RepID=UPI003C6C3443